MFPETEPFYPQNHMKIRTGWLNKSGPFKRRLFNNEPLNFAAALHSRRTLP